MTIDLDPTQTLAAAVAVLLLGRFVLSKVGFLRNNDIPVPVVGGILFAVLTSVLFSRFDTRIAFDMELRDPMMLMFFTSIGLTADVRSLRRGGPRLLVFAGVCLAFLLVQNALGVLVSLGLDLHPLFGLLSASITLSGGHATGAAYAERFAHVQNLAGTMELAMACATFGLIIGGFLGGPVAGRLIRRHRLEPGPEADAVAEQADEDEPESPIAMETLLPTLLLVLVCLIVGGALAERFADAAFTLPGIVWCLMTGVVICNLGPFVPFLRVHRPTVDLLGTVSLALFLAMALMSLRLWELLGLAGPLLALLAVQTLGMAAFATFVTFRVLGRQYDAAIIAGGHCGFGLGATPTAVANMQALTRRFGPSPQAFLVVPLTGAFFIDLLNAAVIQGYLSLPIYGF
ncbi:MAG: sodium/glutamate symporter [Myxococcota bacterium]|nr:sodium/glutamate symporter [Myxococcota bacterium]